MARSEHPTEYFTLLAALMGMGYDETDHSFDMQTSTEVRSTLPFGDTTTPDPAYLDADTLEPMPWGAYSLRRAKVKAGELGASDYERD